MIRMQACFNWHWSMLLLVCRAALRVVVFILVSRFQRPAVLPAMFCTNLVRRRTDVQQIGCEPKQRLLLLQPAPGLFPDRLVLLLRYRLRRVACRVRAATPVPESYGHFFILPVVGNF
jgi:hypothetical protein